MSQTYMINVLKKRLSEAIILVGEVDDDMKRLERERDMWKRRAIELEQERDRLRYQADNESGNYG